MSISNQKYPKCILKVSKSAKKYQKVSKSIKKYQKVSKNIKKYQKLPKSAKGVNQKMISYLENNKYRFQITNIRSLLRSLKNIDISALVIAL